MIKRLKYIFLLCCSLLLAAVAVIPWRAHYASFEECWNNHETAGKCHQYPRMHPFGESEGVDLEGYGIDRFIQRATNELPPTRE